MASLSFSSSLSSLALFASLASSSAIPSHARHHESQAQATPFMQEVPEAVFVAPPRPLNDTTPGTDSSPSTSASTLASENSKSPMLAAYYPDWAGDRFPPEKVDFTRFDWIDFAFAIPNADLSLTWDNAEDSPKLLARLVEAAHKAGKKVKLSVGGWTGSG